MTSSRMHWLVVGAALVLGGCSTRLPGQVPHPTGPSAPASLERASGQTPDGDVTTPPAAAASTKGPDVAALRRLSALAPSTFTRTTAVTAEAWDPELAAALRALKAAPSGDALRAVGEVYARLGVLDTAYDYFTHALDADHHDAAAFDGRARIWKAWRLPDRGLGDAYRARYHAPMSPIVHHTLGTLLQAIGRIDAARDAYERAVSLDPDAAYAHNNLCYLSWQTGALETAAHHCEAALEIDPGLRAARNNLALVRAAEGRLDLARRELFTEIDEATGQFNLGMVLIAARQYDAAEQAFDAARVLQPSFHQAATMARYAGTLAAGPPRKDLN